MENQTAQGRYNSLSPKRETYLRRARDAAKLTIPALFTEENSNETTKLYTPFQSIGARGINNLSSKLLLALMPPNAAFFKLAVDDFMLEQMTQQEGMRGEVEKALGQIERAVMTEIEGKAIRVKVGGALKQLLVAGNALLFLNPKGGMRVFKLDSYVVRRDPMGTVLEIVVKESKAVISLPKELQEDIQNTPETKDSKTVDLFTRIHRVDNKWEIYQEVKGKTLPSTVGSYPLDKSPWIPLRFTEMDGEDYGRGYVEEYYGDLRSLEALTKAIVEGSAAAAKLLIFVDPNGVTRAKTVSEAENCAVVAGNSGDVTTLQMDKFADFRIAESTSAKIEQRLAFAFLMNTAVQRGGERVTAEEIRYMAGELEDALGGVYSILALEMQLPLVQRLMFQMERAKKVPTLPKDTVKPTITTGLEALGRGHDLNKLDVFVAGIGQTLGPEAVKEELNVGEYLSRRGTALGIDMKGLVKSKEQKDQEAQAAQEAAMAQNQQATMTQGGMDMAKEAVKAGMKNV